MISQSQQEEKNPVQLFHPGQAAVAKLKDIYRQVLYVKPPDGRYLEQLRCRLEPVLERHPLFAGVQIQFDFDPMGIY